MNKKQLWKLVGLLFELYIIYFLGSMLLGAILSSFWPGVGDLIAKLVLLALCASALIQHLSRTMTPPVKVKQPPLPKEAINRTAKGPDQKKTIFKRFLKRMDTQKKRMNTRIEILDQLIVIHFGNGSLNQMHYNNAIQEMQELFERNLSKIDERISIFDEIGYQELVDQHQEFSDQVLPYLKHFEYIEEHLDLNERILLDLDDLSAQIQSLDESDLLERQEDILKNFQSLIKQTKELE